MELFYATKNQGKIQSLQRELEKYNVKVLQAPLEIHEPRSDDVVKIAKEKVLFAYNELKKPVVALDAGFYIPSLNGFPKAFANFALETIGLEGILKLVENKKRNCEFRECLAYIDKSLKNPKYFISHIKGILAEKIRGKMQEHLWSEIGLIFIPENYDKTLAEMTHEEYVMWTKTSLEANATGRNFAKWYSLYLENPA
ncbi:MAG: hypothetical protein IB618_02450 [Candidatus Pacearchaeota archaeon]|nr:MAG: hypothetical protein IB618_02450 [Candidatus Pacearchaeota archaeon]